MNRKTFVRGSWILVISFFVFVTAVLSVQGTEPICYAAWHTYGKATAVAKICTDPPPSPLYAGYKLEVWCDYGDLYFNTRAKSCNDKGCPLGTFIGSAGKYRVKKSDVNKHVYFVCWEKYVHPSGDWAWATAEIRYTWPEILDPTTTTYATTTSTTTTTSQPENILVEKGFLEQLIQYLKELIRQIFDSIDQASLIKVSQYGGGGQNETV